MEKNSKLRLNAISFMAQSSPDNPDALHFSAVVGYVDTPSDGSPCGAPQGYKVQIDASTIDLESLVGSGVNVSWDDEQLKDHATRFKVGVIDSASLNGNAIEVKGHLWKSDFGDVCETLECAKESLGCSVEVWFESYDADDENKVIIGHGAHFTGVAILYKNLAAFEKTSFMCALQQSTRKEKDLDEALKKDVETLKADFAALKEDGKKTAEDGAKEFEVMKEKLAKVDSFEAQFKAVTDSIAELTDLIKAGVQKTEAKAEEPRKTKTEFATQKQMDAPKNMLELSKEIDANASLSNEEKWAAKVNLWNKTREE